MWSYAPSKDMHSGMTNQTNKGQRIAKFISRAGIESRRGAERLVWEGRVAVNNKPIDSPAFVVRSHDSVTVDGKLIELTETARLWRYHKRAGLVTTRRDEKNRKTVFDDLPSDLPRLMPVGRLDLTSEGLLLLTNHGGMKRLLEHPSTGWLRKYRVRAYGRVSETQVEKLRHGIVCSGEKLGPMEVQIDRRSGSNSWYTVGLRQGRNREVRKAMQTIGLTVNRLIRISFGPFQLGDLSPGELKEVRRKALREQIGDFQRFEA